MPFIGTWKILAGGDNEPEERKQLISVTTLPLGDWVVFNHKAKDNKGNEYDIINPTYWTFSWKTFSGILKYKFNIGERYMAEIYRLYDKKSYNGSIGSIQIIKITIFGTKIYL